MARFFRLVLGASFLALMATIVGAVVAKRRVTSVGMDTDDEVALVAIFEPLEFESHALAFRGGTVLLWFGGGDLDLRGVRLDPGGARLTIRTIFGGGRLLVPEGWDVELRVRAIFGGVGDARPAFERAPDAPHLLVDGLAIFGGFGILSAKSGRGALDEGDGADD
jgi:hypothetical protein